MEVRVEVETSTAGGARDVLEVQVVSDAGCTTGGGPMGAATSNLSITDTDTTTTIVLATTGPEEEEDGEDEFAVQDRRLRDLYARFKASSLRFDFSDDQNMATLAALPVVQSYLTFSSSSSLTSASSSSSSSSTSTSSSSMVVFSEDDLFCLIFRLNRPFPLMTAAEETASTIRRRLTPRELLEVSTGLIMRCVLRMRYRDVHEQMAHLCGGRHNAPDLGFFLDHDQVFVVVPRRESDDHARKKNARRAAVDPDDRLRVMQKGELAHRVDDGAHADELHVEVETGLGEQHVHIVAETGGDSGSTIDVDIVVNVDTNGVELTVDAALITHKDGTGEGKVPEDKEEGYTEYDDDDDEMAKLGLAESDDEDWAMNPWVCLRANVTHVISDKASVLDAVRAILKEARDHKLTLLVLRQRFERACGVPFGSVGCGSLVSFVRKHRDVFYFEESRKKKNDKSTVTLLTSSSQLSSRSSTYRRGSSRGAHPRQDRSDQHQHARGGHHTPHSHDGRGPGRGESHYQRNDRGGSRGGSRGRGRARATENHRQGRKTDRD